MADGIPSMLRKLVQLAEETRVDLAVASEAQAAMLHKLDQLLTRGNGRRSKTSRVRKRRRRGAHRSKPPVVKLDL